jgi:hypothetical protein
MYDIDNATAAPSEPTRGAVGVQPDAFFQDQPTGGTILPADFMNMLMKELGLVITSAGLTKDKADDTQLHESIGLLCDTEYVEITGGTVNPQQSSNGTHIYNIADFTGPGTIATAEIRSLHLRLEMSSAADLLASIISCDYGGVAGVEIGYFVNADTGSNDTIGNVNFTVDVPINKGQSQFSFTITSTSPTTVTIFGATQRTFS